MQNHRRLVFILNYLENKIELDYENIIIYYVIELDYANIILNYLENKYCFKQRVDWLLFCA